MPSRFDTFWNILTALVQYYRYLFGGELKGMIELNKTYGIGIDNLQEIISEDKIPQYINLKLAAMDQPHYRDGNTAQFLKLMTPLLDNYKEQSRLLAEHQSPITSRVQAFLDDYLKAEKTDHPLRLPSNTFNLDTHGLARTLSVPADSDKFESDIVKSYRTPQGILTNPKHDKRTTSGVFHVVEGGLAIPNDKKAVPKQAFAGLLAAALRAPDELMKLPYTSNQESQAKTFVSLLLRPTVVPEVAGVISEKSLEVCFLAPGSLVSNLDFVESIFGNAGDPNLPENDAALEPESWTGHSGMVILAPHLITVKKKEVGLPHYDDATERQRTDGMCWLQDDELYNDGGAFKVTARTKSGVVLTLIADNYFGYCKKEVKTQIGFSANLYGLAEEEHAGGALAFPSYDLGQRFHLSDRIAGNDLTYDEMIEMYPEVMDPHAKGYAHDKRYDNIIYIPKDARFSIYEQSVTWKLHGEVQSIKLLPGKFYMYPSGYRVEMLKRTAGNRWHLVGTRPEGTLCHKPCTVSGGGKSEISKSISDAMIPGPVIVSDLPRELERVEEIMNKDFTNRFKNPHDYRQPPRSILSKERSLGSVIKLLTLSEDYSDEYNAWLESIPQRIKDIIYIIKRRNHNERDENWLRFLSVDMVNGIPGNELKYRNSKLSSNYLRVGHDQDKSWRIFQVRQDFYPAQKVQVEDDITASITVRADRLANLNPDYANPSLKLLTNCESRLFQRPDDCVIKGYDKQAELELSSPHTFLSNFEPLNRAQVQEIKDDTIGFDQYTQPVQDLINDFLAGDTPEFLVVPSEPRLMDGKPSANPRYLQIRPDLVDAVGPYIAQIGTRLFRKIPREQPVYLPVNSVLPGRRNNPADRAHNVPPLAVYSPIHYQELPELFIDFICSITGKSPSTTGFGSEGALTKGPFNSLVVAADLNNALLSYILGGYEPLTSAAGYVGPLYKVDHDISLLMPELISRMTVVERTPAYLIKNGYLEKIDDMTYKGQIVESSLLGYRITHKFVNHFMGRIFSNPEVVFSDDMLKPETQDIAIFAESMHNLSVTQKRVAEGLLTDGTYEALIPPLQALVAIMVSGEHKGMGRTHADFRQLFTREYVLGSEWYGNRLELKQTRDKSFWSNSLSYLEQKLSTGNQDALVQRLNLNKKRAHAKDQLNHVSSSLYLDELQGTIGADPLEV